jgi:hypothetical protein
VRMRLGRRSSGRPPGGSLLLDEVGRGTTERYLCPCCDALEDFGGRRASYFPLEDLLDVVREVLPPGTCAPRELSVQAIGDVPYLDHLRHVDSMSHVEHMSSKRGGRASQGLAVVRAPINQLH